MSGPLQGLKVLDVSMGAVGPWAGALLGMLGADVIKLESPQGDFIRQVMPTKRGLGVTYITLNFNKRGLVLDLKNATDSSKARELVTEADVFIENFRPGVADRLGIGYKELSAINPKLIYASASGFGPSGPMVKIGATDPHIQPFTGSCSVNGRPGGKRQRWRWYGHFDCTTSMCIVEGVLSALIERATSGRGKLVLVTMVEAAMALQRVRISEHLSGATPEPMGSAVSYLVPDQAFETKDRPLAVTASSRREWRALCETIGAPDLVNDPRFARNPTRVKHRAVLIPLLQDIFKTRSAGFWLDRLQQAKVPAALFTSYDEFRLNLHYLENKMLTTLDTRSWGKLTVGGVPWRFEKTPGELWPGTVPGGNTAEIKARGWSAIGA